VPRGGQARDQETSHVSFDVGPRAASSPLKDQSLGPVLRALGRHWLLVLVVVSVSTGIAVSTVMRKGSMYEATASVLVKPLPDDNAGFISIGVLVDSGDATRTIQTAAVLIRTPAAAASAAREMGAGWRQARVQNAVRVEPRGESYVVDIIATAPTAANAARLANAYVKAALDERARIVRRNLKANIKSLRARLIKLQRLQSDPSQLNILTARLEDLRALEALGTDPSLQLSERAQRPAGPTGISRPILLAFALIGGLILGTIAALSLEYFTRRIRDEAELTHLCPIPVLAGIPMIRGLRKGHGFDARALSPGVIEQVRLLRAQLPSGDPPVSLMITSANSGDGKTTTATALATVIALSDQDVVLLDLDPFKADPKSMFEIHRPHHTPESDVTPLDRMLHPVFGLPHLRVLPAPLGDGLNLGLFLRQLPELLAEAKGLAGCVIVDAPPVGEIGDALRIATACDHTVFVVRPRQTNRARFILTRDMLSRAGVTPIGIVIVGQRLAGVSSRYGYYEANTRFNPRQDPPLRADESTVRLFPGERLKR